MRKFKKLNVIRETDNETIIEKLLDDGFEEVEEVVETKSTKKGKEEERLLFPFYLRSEEDDYSIIRSDGNRQIHFKSRFRCL